MSRMKYLATEHYRQGIRIRNATEAVMRREWRKLDPDDLNGSFYGSVWPRLIATVELAQTRAAGEADSYLDELFPDLDPLARIDANAFAGTASDGRSLESLLELPLIATKTALSRSQSVSEALAVGETGAALIGGSEATDAGRLADGVATTTREELTGYVRMLTLPSCPRCVVLAGQTYKWNDGFERHPRCDCRHIPISEDVPGDVRTDPRAAVESGKVNGLSKSDRQAIEDGADVGQVINAHRGMYTTADGRKMTTEGTTARGWAGMAMGARRGKKGRVVRARPEEIYKVATSRSEAISMLRKSGYFVDRESIS